MGYLGVDIFFVISGYVITNSIYEQQLIKNKSIFFFYVRRIKRIFPILLLVIFSFLFFYLILSPLSGNTNFIVGSAASSLVGLSNLFFIHNDTNYFLSDVINPLLHTWSLGIEEQFYLFYPILIVFTYKVFQKNTEKIFNCIFLFSIASLLIAVPGLTISATSVILIMNFFCLMKKRHHQLQKIKKIFLTFS